MLLQRFTRQTEIAAVLLVLFAATLIVGCEDSSISSATLTEDTSDNKTVGSGNFDSRDITSNVPKELLSPNALKELGEVLNLPEEKVKNLLLGQVDKKRGLHFNSVVKLQQCGFGRGRVAPPDIDFYADYCNANLPENRYFVGPNNWIGSVVLGLKPLITGAGVPSSKKRVIIGGGRLDVLKGVFLYYGIWISDSRVANSLYLGYYP